MTEGVIPVRHGVIPAAGLGTRFLPISRTVPKELLPLVDTPVIEIVVTEMTAAGIEQIVIVSAPGKEAVEAYFRPNERLERRLAVESREQDLALLKRPQSSRNRGATATQCFKPARWWENAPS